VGIKYEWRTQEEVVAAASDLRATVELLTAVAKKMKDSGFPKAIYLWTESTFDALEMVNDLPKTCDIMLTNQITAKGKGKKSKYEKSMEKSLKDAARKKKKAAEKAAEQSTTETEPTKKSTKK
jgi:hypothetical protein